VRQTTNGVTTNYAIDLAGGLTQVLADSQHAYLYGNGRIAQHRAGGVDYFLGDALGSVRQLVDGDGNVILTKGYAPYGEVMGSAGSGATSYGYTGEFTDSTGLVYLRARYLDPYLNQFIQPDPIVPDPYTPADWNRYTYVRNNPIRYIDPSGKCIDFDLDGLCDPGGPDFENLYGVTFDRYHTGLGWSEHPDEAQAAVNAITKVANRLSPYARLSPGDTFRRVFGGIDFKLEDLGGYFGWTSGPHLIKIKPGKVAHNPCNKQVVDFQRDPLARLFVHEIGHAFSGRLDEQYRKLNGVTATYGNNPENLLQNEGIYDPYGNFVTGYDRRLGSYNRNAGLDPGDDRYPYLGGTYFEVKWNNGIRTQIYTGYQWHSEQMDDAGNTSGEDWADIFMNWVYGNAFRLNWNGLSIYFWAENHMQEWVDMATGKPIR
jgi:RHS repeat-associated protein